MCHVQLSFWHSWCVVEHFPGQRPYILLHLDARLALVGTAGPQEFGVELGRPLDLCKRVSLCDVLRAIPVEGLDGELEDAFHGGVVVGRCHLREEFRVIGGSQHDRLSPDLESLTIDVVHQEQHGLSGCVKVARADELAVAAEVGERQYVVL